MGVQTPVRLHTHPCSPFGRSQLQVATTSPVAVWYPQQPNPCEVRGQQMYPCVTES